MKRWNKKGNIQDMFPAMAIIFGTAIALVIIYFVFIRIQTPMGSALGQEKMMNQTQGALQMFDTLYPFFVIGLILWVIISAFFIRSYPFLFWVGVLLLAIAIIIGAVLSNVYKQAFIDNEEMRDAVVDFEITSWLVNKLPYIVLVMFCIIAFVLYAKPSGGDI